MKWERAPVLWQAICLLLSFCAFAAAWHLTMIGASGIEDVPPPFILVAGLAGFVFAGVAVIGRYPRPGAVRRVITAL